MKVGDAIEVWTERVLYLPGGKVEREAVVARGRVKTLCHRGGVRTWTWDVTGETSVPRFPWRVRLLT